jgi:putative PEP-CTERM system histidine kinase
VNTFGLISFGAAFAGFAGLTVLLSVARGGGDPAVRRLRNAMAVSALWALTLALHQTELYIPPVVILGAELLRDLAWLIALLGLAPASLPRAFAPVSYTLLGVWAAAALVGPAIGIASIETMMSGGGFCMALLILLLLEQVYRNVPEPARANLKFLAIGVGGLFTYDLFLYAQAVMLAGDGLDAVSWYARGFANVLMMPLLLFGARRLPNVDLKVFVSRQVTFYTTTFLATGIYLLLMSFAGYAIRELGGAWGETARGVFLIGAFALLVILVTSAAMRRHLRVFVSKHFYQNKYDYRVEWLRFSKTLSARDATDVPRTSVQAVAQTLGAPGGVLFTLDDSGRRFVPNAGWPLAVADLPRLGALGVEEPLAGLLRSRRWIVDLHERRAKPARYDQVELPAWLDEPRWRIVSPIFRLDVLIGFFVLFDPPPPFELEYEDRDLLHTMGQHVATMLAQHEADRRVAEMSQFETYNRLTAFVMHDLKNCAAQLSLVVGNAVKHRHNPEFIDDAIATISNTSERVTRLIEQLSRRSTQATPAPPVRLAELVAAAVERCQARVPKPVLASGANCDCMVNAEREQLVTAIEHVVRNAQDATAESGNVTIDIADGAGTVRVTVSDDGAGMDPDFIQHWLFRPFHSTKGSKGMGIGAYQARELAMSLGGDVEVESRPGAGTRFSFILPVAA